jgi:superfamily I DNA/RNA helicase
MLRGIKDAGDVLWLKQRLTGNRKKQKSILYAIRVAETNGPAAIDGDPALTFGSIHSVKGAEADCVFLSPDVSTAAWKQLTRPSERDHISRVFYVGMTRARESLFLCSRSGFAFTWPGVQA